MGLVYSTGQAGDQFRTVTPGLAENSVSVGHVARNSSDSRQVGLTVAAKVTISAL